MAWINQSTMQGICSVMQIAKYATTWRIAGHTESAFGWAGNGLALVWLALGLGLAGIGLALALLALGLGLGLAGAGLVLAWLVLGLGLGLDGVGLAGTGLVGTGAGLASTGASLASTGFTDKLG